MKKVGFIGYGSMGNMLVNGFLSSKALNTENTIISSRTMSKTDYLIKQWPGITLTGDNRKVARESELLFICVKPLDVFPVLQEIKNDLSEKTHLVSIAGCVTINDIESLFPGQISRVIPSITSEVKEGTSLVCHNNKVTGICSKRLESMLNSISEVVYIKEENFEVAASLTSSAPGTIAAIFDNFIQTAVKHSTIPADVAQQMVIPTLFGTAKLMVEKGFNFSEMISRVATKGGITEEGVKVLNKYLPETFNEVFIKMLSKHALLKEMISKQRLPKI